MSHQSEIEKKKYRNWVKGGLAYKYLKQGLEDFAGDAVNKEHKRVLAAVNNTAGINCNHCCLRNLQPNHTCKRDHTGKKTCPYGLFNCNCLHGKKQRCPSNICDGIMEEILKSHGSSPPQPYWQNTDIQKWCTEPWEVAKCFINAPGYSDKRKAADIDISGFLHVFINNINLHSHLACSMTGSSNIFTKVRGRRNSIFHSPSMEMEDTKLTECVDDIIAILEDTKELNMRKNAQEAVKKLRKLRTEDLIITTHNEIEVCREALSTVPRMTEELKQLIQDAKEDINMKQANATKVIDGEIQTALKGALDVLSNNGDIKKLEQAMKLIDAKVDRLDLDYKQRLSQIEDDITALKDIGNQKKTTERLEYLENKQKLQEELVKYYKKYYVNTSLTPLMQQQDSTNVRDIYVPPEIEVMEGMDRKGNETARNSKLHPATDEQVGTPCKIIQLDKDQYSEMIIQPKKKTVKGYRDIFQTKNQRHKKIYILGDVGTGKSTFCKMMIENWCYAVNDRTNDATKTISSDENMANECDDVSQIAEFEFLFYIPLQYMSSCKSDATVDMIKELTTNLTSNTELIGKIFLEDSMRCLIIADSLDEWTPPKEAMRKPHVSYGIPDGDKAKYATVITLSRPSGIGILNLRNSEVDLKLQLLGISGKSLRSFIERYISNSQVSNKTYDEFIKIIKTKQIKHVEKTPLFLQQLLWLYCNGIDIGKSVCETYCQILNTMCGWSDRRKEGRENDVSLTGPNEVYKNLNLTKSLDRFPRIKSNIHILYLLGQIAFETFTSDNVQATFGLSIFEKYLSKDDIKELTDLGILNKSTCFGQMHEDTQFSFIHISYIEFFAALYLAIYYNIGKPAPVNPIDREVPVLDLLFHRCKSTSDVLQLSNVIKMICGLSPDLIGGLSRRISSIVNEDKHVLQIRKSVALTETNELYQIQRLIVNCLKEGNSDDQTIICVSDLYIKKDKQFPPLWRINPENVISLSIEFSETFGESIKYIKEFAAQCIQIQSVCVSSDNCIENFQFLFSEKAFLKVLIFSRVIRWDIDPSMQNQLQILKRLYIEFCQNVDLYCFLSASSLTCFSLYSSYGNFTSLPSLLKQALFLRQLILIGANCDQDIYIDLSRNNHLHELEKKFCSNLLIIGLNTKQLEQVDIQNSILDDFPATLEFTHTSANKLSMLYLEHVTVNIAQLVQLLQQAPIQNLTMKFVSDAQQTDAGGDIIGVSGAQAEVEGFMHVIDLSKQNKLKTLLVNNCDQIKISNINTDHLEQVSIVYEKDYNLLHSRIPVLDFNNSSNTSKLNKLELERLTANVASLASLIQQATLRELTLTHIFDVSVESDMHVILVDLSRRNQLQVLRLSHCKHIKISALNTEMLEDVHIDSCPDILDIYLLSNACKLKRLYLNCLTANIASLTSLIQQATLRYLNLTNVSGVAVESDMHVRLLDLSKQNQLYYFVLSNCKNIQISELNTQQIEKVHIEHCPGILDFDPLLSAERLTQLYVEIDTNHMISLPSVLQQIPFKQLIFHSLQHDQDIKHNADVSRHSHLQNSIPVKCCVKVVNAQQRMYFDILRYFKDPGFYLNLIILSNASNQIELHLNSLICDISSLLSVIQHNTLRHLTLTKVSGYQCDDASDMYVKHVDLSKQNQLQGLKLSHCKNIKISALNTEQLEHVHIESCPGIFDFFLVSDTSKLNELYLKCLTVNIASLETLIQQAALKKLTLTHISGFAAEGDMHVRHVDLSKQNKLQYLHLSNCKNIEILKLNTERILKVHIEHCPGILDFDLLSNAESLTVLYVEFYTNYVISLPSVLQQAPFKQLTSHTRKVQCEQDKQHYADLSTQSHLQKPNPVKCCVKVVEWCQYEPSKYSVMFVDYQLCRSDGPVLDLVLYILSNASNQIKLHLKDLICDISSLLSLLQQDTLRHLNLTRIFGDQSDDESNKRVIHVDLSKQNQLQILNLSDCKNIKISHLSTEQLEQVCIENCADVFDFCLLSKASKLTELSFTGVTCNTYLASLQAVNCGQLGLENMSADQPVCEGDMHVVRVDLSTQSQLQVLYLYHCKNIRITGLNTEQLRVVNIVHCPGILEFELLSNASNLTELSLRGDYNGDRFQYTKQIDDIVHTLHQLITFNLWSVDIDDNALTISKELKSLKYIELYNTNISLKTWCTFVDSLLFLYQSVTVRTDDKIQKEKRDYVRKNPKLNIHRRCIFSFKSSV